VEFGGISETFLDQPAEKKNSGKRNKDALYSPCLSHITLEEEIPSGATQRAREDETLRSERLNIVEELINAFNLADVTLMEDIMKDKVVSDVTMTFAEIPTVFQGKNALLLYFLLTQETFPDGMWKCLEKRSVNTMVPKGKKISDFSSSQLSPKVEFVTKFTGMRILPYPTYQSMKLFVEKYPTYASMSAKELTNNVSKFVSQIDTANTDMDTTTNYITEGLISFTADTSIISELFWTLLASS
jgi:hypothetical protein